PPGVVNIITAMKNTPEVGEAITSSDIVKKVSFTGSTGVGKLLMKQSADTLKKLSFELGGNAPFIVFDDADLETAVNGAIASKFRSSGQTCVCANRLYIQRGIYDKFAEAFTEKVKNFKVGHGYDEGVTHGPLIHDRAVSKVEAHVKDAVKQGGKVLVGGQKLPDLGDNFFQPTVIRDMTADMALAHEETFGPVAGLFPFDTEAEVVKLANDTEVGLAGYFFSRDIQRVYRVAEALEVGMVGVNTGLISDPAAPFGGVKQSGFGREGSKIGIDEYMVTKMVTLGGMGQPLQGELIYKFCKYMIRTFIEVDDEHVLPFREPVDANDVPDYYTIIKNPMDLSTISKKFKDGKYTRIELLRLDFERMFANCFKYNRPGSKIYKLGKSFQVVFNRIWRGRDDWIKNKVAEVYPDRLSSTSGDEDDSSEKDLHETSDEDQTENISKSDGDTPEDAEMSDEELPIRRRPYVLQRDDSDDEEATEKPKHQSRARKKDGAKQHVDIDIIPNNFDSNNKRHLDTNSPIGNQSPSSPQKQAPMTEQLVQEQTITSTEDHASSAEQEPAKRPRLEPSTESSSDSLPQTPAQQSPTQQPAEEPQQQSTPDTRFKSLRTLLKDILNEQTISFLTRILENTDGKFDEHLYIWNLLCRNGQRPEFERVWKAKAMVMVIQMRYIDIMNDSGVQEQVERAYAETAVEQVREFLDQATQHAAALGRSVDKHDGDTNDG
ncbi:succinic semialdehyde dehydrogenase, partial [Aureobasidium melanogenum]